MRRLCAERCGRDHAPALTDVRHDGGERNADDRCLLLYKESLSLTVSQVGGLYGEHTPPTDLADRIAESNPKLVAKLYHKRIIPKLAEADADLLDGLAKAGFKTWSGPEGSGFLMSTSGPPSSVGIECFIQELADENFTSGLGESRRVLLLHRRIGDDQPRSNQS